MSNLISQKYGHYYRVYGLTLGANIEIPGLDAEKVVSHTADIDINMGYVPDDIQRLITQPSAEYFIEPGYEKETPPHLIVNTLADGRYFHFCYGYGVEFVCDRGATIVWGAWKTSVVLEDAALYLLGPIIGFMLRLRGITCLHASGAVVDGSAFALTGPSGAGKSTMAASFAALGYPIMTDDILPLNVVNEVIQAETGYSRLRLFPNSFENLPDLPDSLPLLTPSWDKCYLNLALDSYQLHVASAPLEVVYIIDWGVDNADSPSIAALSAAAALPLLAANTYRNELLSPTMRMKEFVFLGRMVSSVKVKKIHPVDDISAIPQMCEIILDDFRREIEHKEKDSHYTGVPEYKEP